jgi:hypothetical protein
VFNISIHRRDTEVAEKHFVCEKQSETEDKTLCVLRASVVSEFQILLDRIESQQESNPCYRRESSVSLGEVRADGSYPRRRGMIASGA